MLFFIEIVSRGCSEEPHPLVHVDVAFGIPSCAERNGRTQRGWRSKQPKSDCSSLRTAISPVDSSSVSHSEEGGLYAANTGTEHGKKHD